MESVTYEMITIERCVACQGLWFDALEHKKLLAMSGSEAIDTGDAQVGRRYNMVEKITCPKCKGALMIEMVDLEQPHIWYEKCSVCHGAYFDAGEFRDLKEKNLSDLLKRIFGKGRG